MKQTLKLLAFVLLAPHASLLGHRRSIRFGKLTLKGNP
jgi:hypothetical protein